MNRKLITAAVVIPLGLIFSCVLGAFFVNWVRGGYIAQKDSLHLTHIIPVPPLKSARQEVRQPTVVPTTNVMPTISATLPPVSPSPTVVVNEIRLAPTEVPPTPLPTASVEVTEQKKEITSRLVIPKLNLDSSIILAPIENETWKVDHLQQAVGHLEGTALPGSDSNIVLAGHVTLSSGVDGPFASLTQLAPNDILYIYKNNQRFQYIVTGAQTVDHSAIEVTYPSAIGEITLITCSNWNAGENRYLERLIVKGHLVKG